MPWAGIRVPGERVDDSLPVDHPLKRWQMIVLTAMGVRKVDAEDPPVELIQEGRAARIKLRMTRIEAEPHVLPTEVAEKTMDSEDIVTFMLNTEFDLGRHLLAALQDLLKMTSGLRNAFLGLRLPIRQRATVKDQVLGAQRNQMVNGSGDLGPGLCPRTSLLRVEITKGRMEGADNQAGPLNHAPPPGRFVA
jgi:hypothetical protein